MGIGLQGGVRGESSPSDVAGEAPDPPQNPVAATAGPSMAAVRTQPRRDDTSAGVPTRPLRNSPPAPIRPERRYRARFERERPPSEEVPGPAVDAGAPEVAEWSDDETGSAEAQSLTTESLPVARPTTGAEAARTIRFLDTHSEAAAPTPFALQVGAFRRRENAELLVAELQHRGYTAYIRQVEDSRLRIWHRVRVGRYSTMTEAEAAASEFMTAEERAAVVWQGN